MPRPEKPVTTSNRALYVLAEWLRDQRDRTGQGYRALAVRAGCHATTLQRAASGESVPKLPTVLAYARACDASPEEARRLWRQARYEHTRQARGGRGLPAPKPEFIRDFADLGAALQDLYERAGSPTMRAMEQRGGEYGVLPRSTVHRIVHKQAMPYDLLQFKAYLKACEVPEESWWLWEWAWTRAWRHEKQDREDAAGGMPGMGAGTADSPWFAAPDVRGTFVIPSGRSSPAPATVRQPPPPPPLQQVPPEWRVPVRRAPERQITGQLSFPIGGPDPEGARNGG
ncbi:helix-turn-helix domain-containing protein [Streptomyces sp. CAS3]